MIEANREVIQNKQPIGVTLSGFFCCWRTVHVRHAQVIALTWMTTAVTDLSMQK